jgi:hypothetical protein
MGLLYEVEHPMTKEERKEICDHMQLMAFENGFEPPCLDCTPCTVRYCTITGMICTQFDEYVESAGEEFNEVKAGAADEVIIHPQG